MNYDILRYGNAKSPVNTFCVEVATVSEYFPEVFKVFELLATDLLDSEIQHLLSGVSLKEPMKQYNFYLP